MAQASMPFGKYAGTPIDEVPAEYLTWALSNMTKLRPDTLAMMKGSLARRQGGGAAKAPNSEVPDHVHTWQLVPEPETPGERVEQCSMCHARQRIIGRAAATAQQPRPTSGSYNGGGIACPACGEMLDVSLAVSQVPF